MRIQDLVHACRRQFPHKTSIRWCPRNPGEREEISYSDLVSHSENLAQHFRHKHLAGERVVISVSHAPSFVIAFLACLQAGAIAVPAPPSRHASRRTMSQIQSLSANAGARLILADKQSPSAPYASEEDWYDWQWLDLQIEGQRSSESGEAADIALLQYTSGSTSAPKGVVISHANLLAQVAVLREKFCVTSASRITCWLPLFHDMGLISVIAGLCHGCTLSLIPSIQFVQTPLLWLETISEQSATHSGGPNFAFDLVARKLAAADPGRLDLSTWKYAYCGAEPIQVGVMRKFAEACASYDFDPKSLYPCYGLAESTLLVTGSNERRGVRTLTCDKGSLERGDVVLAGHADKGVELVSCGRPAHGHELVIVDPATQDECGELRVGEICIRGPSVSAGYWRSDGPRVKSEADASPEIGRQYLRTGDLGFLRLGELLIVGRIKDVIIRNGRNIYPQDVEALVESVETDAKFGKLAAFGLDADAQARMIVVIEVRRLGDEGIEDLRKKISSAIRTELEETNFELVFVRCGVIPTTSSGKQRRHELRSLYLSGQIKFFDAAQREPEQASGHD